jgi:hypothetical protein
MTDSMIDAVRIDRAEIMAELLDLRRNLMRSYKSKLEEGEESIGALVALFCPASAQTVQFLYPTFEDEEGRHEALAEIPAIVEGESAAGIVLVQHANTRLPEVTDQFRPTLAFSCMMPGWCDTHVMQYQREMGELEIFDSVGPVDDRALLHGLAVFPHTS